MKRVRAIALVVTSLLLGATALACANQPHADPLPPSAEPLPSDGAPPADAPEAAPHPGAKRAPCVLGQDQTCNSDPKVSALWGKCLETGVCECNPGFELNAMGSCAPVQ